MEWWERPVMLAFWLVVSLLATWSWGFWTGRICGRREERERRMHHAASTRHCLDDLYSEGVSGSAGSLTHREIAEYGAKLDAMEPHLPKKP